MVKCELIGSYALTKNTQAGRFNFEYTKDSTVGAASVKLFVWNNLTNLMAVSENTNI